MLHIPTKHVIIILLKLLNQVTIKHSHSSIKEHIENVYQNLHTISSHTFSFVHLGL